MSRITSAWFFPVSFVPAGLDCGAELKGGNGVKAVKRKSAKTRPEGRPTKYQLTFAEQARKLCQLGATDVEMAEFFGVSERTINNWKRNHSEFLQSIKRGKLISDADVAERLFMRATGYSHPDTHISNFQGEITITPLVKHYPPDTTAAIFWLKNRRPAAWRDKVELNHSGSVDIEVTIGGEDAE